MMDLPVNFEYDPVVLTFRPQVVILVSMVAPEMLKVLEVPFLLLRIISIKETLATCEKIQHPQYQDP